MTYPRSSKAEVVPVLKKCSIVLTRIEFNNCTMRTSARHHNLEVHRDTDLKIMIKRAQSAKTLKKDQKIVEFPNKTALQKMSPNIPVVENLRRMQSADTLSLSSLSLAENFVAQLPTTSVLQQQSKTLKIIDKISHCECSCDALIEFKQELNTTSSLRSPPNSVANSGNDACIMPVQCIEQTVPCKPHNLLQNNLERGFDVPKKYSISQDEICMNNREHDVKVDEEFKTPKNPSTELTNKTVIDSGTWMTCETSYIVSQKERDVARCNAIKQSRIESSMLDKRMVQQHNINEKRKGKRLKSKKIMDDNSALTTQDCAKGMLNLAYGVRKKRRISENLDEVQDDTNLSVLSRKKKSLGSKSTSTVIRKVLTMSTNAYKSDNACTTEQEPLQINENNNVQNQKTLSTKQIAYNQMLLNILNRANILQLQSLPQIGLKTAFTIYHYRELNGSFKSYKDLQKVPNWSLAKLNKFLTANNVVLEE